jgi:hypothetical protein
MKNIQFISNNIQNLTYDIDFIDNDFSSNNITKSTSTEIGTNEKQNCSEAIEIINSDFKDFLSSTIQFQLMKLVFQ